MRLKTHHLYLAIALLAARPAGATQACTCAEEPLARRWADATAVFTGTVTAITPARAFSRKTPAAAGFKSGGEADPPVTVTLQIDESYKGGQAAHDSFTLHTSLNRYTCMGYPFETQGKYLVFAYQRADFKSSRQSLYNFPAGTFDVGGLCGGTKPFEQAAEDLQNMRPAKPSAGWRTFKSLKQKFLPE